jgi:pimeloyl-ACP methyl ester carboxylesterase
MNASFEPWPALAGSAQILPLKKNDTLFYYDSGDRPNKPDAVPAIILVHGLGDEADSWRHLIPLLKAAGFRTLAADLPGFGRSAAHGRINLKRHVAAVCGLLEKTGAVSPANPAILAGSSMGGAIVQAAAAKRPDLVKGLVLVDGGLPVIRKAGFGFLSGTLPVLGSQWYRALRKNPEGAYHSLFGYYGNFEKLPQADKDFLRERVIERVGSAAQERAYFGSYRSIIRANITGKRAFSRRLKAFPGKILILWGEQDHLFPAATAAAPLRSLRPDAAFKVIPGAGHLPHQEKPGETAELIADFAKTLM